MSKHLRGFNAQAFLDSAGSSKTIVEYRRADVIFSQGERCDSVMYIQRGSVKLWVVSTEGREAVTGILGPGEFLGEGCLAGPALRIGNATAIAPSRILVIKKQYMVEALREHQALASRFIAYMLSRNARIEQDLIDQLFNSSEVRLARALLLLARYGTQDNQDKPQRVVPKISQQTLADIVGTTRSRINLFMNKFKRLGFIEYNGDLDVHVNDSLASVVLHV